jgi:hypothetical protein
VKRSGVEVRTQKGYFASKDGPVENASLIASPLESSAIHLLARVERAGNSLSISGSIDLRNVSLEQNSKGEIELLVIQQNATGAVLDERRQAMHVQLTPAQYQAYLKTGLFFRTMTGEKDGWRMLRIVAIDRNSAATGSLLIPSSQIR